MAHETQNDTQTNLFMVVAFIQPFKLDSVTLALEQIPEFNGMSVSDCRGFGHGKLRPEERSTSDVTTPATERAAPPPAEQGLIDFRPKVRLEIAVAGRAHANTVVETIVRTAHTGRRGDGKVLLWPIAHAVRVRTSEVDRDAL
jgi:nitrogen regulatory protein P-II 1